MARPCAIRAVLVRERADSPRRYPPARRRRPRRRRRRSRAAGSVSCSSRVTRQDVELADDAATPEHEDGSEAEVGPGEAYVIEPAHDAWVVGDERFVAFESESRAAEEYARG